MAASKKFSLPFPGRALADRELTYDLCYERIPEKDRARIVEDAWQCGCQAARDAFERFDGCTDFFSVFERAGVKVRERNVDYVVGGQRYFSDYLSGKKTVTLYTKAVALWAEENGLAMRDAENMILSHEFYHHLECTELGLTSRRYQVPMLQLGPVKLGKTGIKALSEIGAHAFVRTYFTCAGLLGKEGKHGKNA